MSESVDRYDTGTRDLDYTLGRLDGFRVSLTLHAACELELFDLVAQGEDDSNTARSIAEQQGWHEDTLERLMDALVALKMLHKMSTSSGERYSCTPSGGYLRRHTEETIWSYAQMAKHMMSGMMNIAEEVKTGMHKNVAFPAHVTVHKAAEQPEKHLSKDHSGKHHRHDGHSHGHKEGHHKKKGHHEHHQGHQGHHGHHDMSAMDSDALYERYKTFDTVGQAQAPHLVKQYDLSNFKTCVDMGAGTGCMGFALARAYKDMKVTLLDVPKVIDLVKKHFIPADFDTLQVDFLPGDFFGTELPKADLYLLSKIVHDWASQQVKDMLARCYDHINPGGGIMLFEKCLNDNKDGPVSAHMWDAFIMALCAGRLRSGREYRQLLQDAGFSEVQIFRTQEACTYDIIFARKF